MFAWQVIKQPPESWEVEVLNPPAWRGRFTSELGHEWWSPVLERHLDDKQNNPGESEVLAHLRAVAREHTVSKLEAVAKAARRLLAVRESGNLSENSLASDQLYDALRALDTQSRPTKVDSSRQLYVGDGRPAVRLPGYEREPEEVESL